MRPVSDEAAAPQSPETEGSRVGPRRWRWVVVGLCAAVLAVGGILLGVWASSGADDRPGLEDRGPAIDLWVGPGVISQDAERVRDLATTAEEILAGYAGGHLPKLSVRVSADSDALAGELGRAMGISQARALAVLERHWGVPWEGTVFVDLSPGRLAYPDDFDWMAIAVVLLYEEQLISTPEGMAAQLGHCSASDDSGAGVRGPWWLWEGVSDYLAYEARFDSKYWTAPEEDAQAIRDSIVSDAYAIADVKLVDLVADVPVESSGAGARADLAYAGVAALVAQSHQQALFDYFSLLGDGECWRAAFERSFGLTVEAFYLLFEQERVLATTTEA